MALEYGQRFTVGDVELEVASVSGNPDTGETVYEVLSVEDADKRRERNQPQAEPEQVVEENPTTAEIEAAAETDTEPEVAAPAEASEEPEILHPRA